MLRLVEGERLNLRTLDRTQLDVLRYVAQHQVFADRLSESGPKQGVEGLPVIVGETSSQRSEMFRILRRISIVAIASLAMASCTAEPKKPSPPPVVPFTQDMANAALTEVATGVSKTGVADFCTKFARSQETCTILLKDGLGRCLLPGDKPTVQGAVHIPATEESEETWQLVVQGKTLDGQKYVSDFPVVLSAGTPKAALAIYWTGQSYGRDVSDSNHDAVIPQNACPR